MKNNFLEANNLFRKYYMWLKGEDLEQAELVLWLELNGYKFTSIPNSTYTESWKQKVKNTLLGLRPWLSDLLIVLKRGSLLFVEMKQKKVRYMKKDGSFWKARKKNDESEKQKEWRDILNSVNNVACVVAFGHKEAIYHIQNLEKK